MTTGRTRLAITITQFCLILTLVNCKSRQVSHASINLRENILAGNFAQFCRQTETGCVNPSILAFEGGLYVTDFHGSLVHHSQVSAQGLADYLTSLPIAAWPRGPHIVLAPSDDVLSPERVNYNLQEATRVCKLLGLETEVRPGG